MRFLSTSIATLLALAGTSAQAAEIFLLNIPGIHGSSTVTGHAGWIPVSSFSDSISNRYNATSARAAGPLACQPLQITKILDNSSPGLFMAVASGRVYPTIELDALTIGEGGTTDAPVPFLHLTLSNAVVSSLKIGGDASDSARTETLTVNAERIDVSFTAPTGGSAEALVTCGGLSG